MKFIPNSITAALLASGVFGAQAAVQVVTPQESSLSLYPGATINIPVSYSTAEPAEQGARGLNLNIYYDSSKFSSLQLSQTFATGLLQQSAAQDDSSDKDGDPSTDKFFQIAWFDLSAAWPGAGNFPASLFTVEGTLTSDFSGSSKINFGLGTDTFGFDGFQSTAINISEYIDQKPVFAAIDPIEVEATGPLTDVTLPVVKATDVEDTDDIVATADNTGPYPVGSNQVTWSATDSYGNTSEAVQIVKVVDTTLPVFTALDDIVISSPDGQPVQVTIPGVSATDIVDGSITASSDLQSGDYAVGGHTITWTATDSSNNTATITQLIRVTDGRDLVDPVVTAPADITLEATGATTAVTLGQATATDNIGVVGDVSPNQTGPFAVGTHTITWKALDASGNAGTATQTVTITDLTAPAVTAPGTIEVEASGNLTEVDLGTATASDLVDGAVTASPSETGPFTVGTHTIDWSATDANNNTGSATQTVVVKDTTAPTVTAPANMTLEATGATTAVDLGSGTATDIVDGDLAPQADVTGPFAVGVHQVTWSVTDAAGNQGSSVQTVTVEDTTAPAFGTLTTLTKEATGAATDVDLGVVTANDLVDGAVTATSDASGGFAVGSTTVTWVAKDAAGNESTQTQKVVITDTTAPVLTQPNDLTVEATGTLTDIDPGLAAALDLVDGNLTPVSNLQSALGLGTHTITWTVTDAAGNQSQASQTIVVEDTTAPQLTVPADLTIEADATLTAVDLGSPTVVDAQQDATTVTPSLTGPFAVGRHDIVWTAKDPSNNEATKTQVVTVVDTTAPEIEQLAPITLDATGVLTAITASLLTAPDVTDIVDGASKAQLASSYAFRPGVNQVTWTAEDAAGNKSQVQQQVNINPIANLSFGEAAEPGAIVELPVYLNGEAASYPVELEVSLSGANSDGYTLQSSTVTIEQGREGKVVVELLDNGTLAGGDEIELELTSASNAALGTKTSASIFVISNNVAPRLTLESSQGGEQTRIITTEGGNVLLDAHIHDGNRNDTHTLEWSSSDSSVVNLASQEGQFEFDPSLLAEGVLELTATATEQREVDAKATSKTLRLIVEAAAPQLSAEQDADNDGIADVDEGFKDSDGDGIADFMDSEDDTTLLPLDESNKPLATEPGLSLKLGDTVLAAKGVDADGAALTLEQLAAKGGEQGQEVDNAEDLAYKPVSQIIDFVVGGLPIPGESVKVVLPLPEGKTLPADAIYRKYDAQTGWQTFVPDTKNELHSAASAAGECPAPGDAAYQVGLNAGDDCVQLTIEDGGLYDSDGEANGEVVDPGMIATSNQAPVAGVASSSITIDEQLVVTLDGSSSTDPESDILSYSWTQAASDTTQVTLSNADQAVASFTAPDVTQDTALSFTLSVTDGNGTSTQDVAVMVEKVNQAPTVSASASKDEATANQEVQLTAQGTDADGDALDYSWKKTSGPAVTISNHNTANASFTVPAQTGTKQTLKFEVTVSDGDGGTATDSVTVTIPAKKKSGGSFGFGLIGLLGLGWLSRRFIKK